MNLKLLSAHVLTIIAAAVAVSAQDPGSTPVPLRTPPPTVRTATPTPTPLVIRVPSPTPNVKISEALGRNLENAQKNGEVSRELREQAYAKLLEGQRYVWTMRSPRGQSVSGSARFAKQAFQKAAELNPLLAEAYTALAELTLTTPPGDMDEAIALASLAVKVDNNNFGAHRILSRLYTIKSALNEENLVPAEAERAITAWKEIARLDPRNAEAWAFLSEFYRRTNKNEDRIAALKNWQGATSPTVVEMRFYQNMLGRQENISPEVATAKLGEALYDAGRIPESIALLNQALADDPENQQTLDLLAKALEKADPATAATAVQTLQQAIYANPENIALVMLLAKVQARSGNAGDAAKFINDTVSKLAERDKAAAANLQVSLGDMYAEQNRPDDAAAAYQKALTLAGIDQNNIATDNEREFAMAIFDKIIRVYKNANRFNEAKSAVERARVLLGEEDSFSDRQMVALYRENGKRQEALQALKAARIRFPDDFGFFRQEATVLMELGRVDEGAAVIRSLIGKKDPSGIPSPMYDDFSNYLFIASLYSDAKRGKEAIEAANQALQIAGGSEERKQIAKLSLASAQQSAGDFKGAETTLRELLTESPNNPNAQNNLGYFLAERNVKLDEALKLIQQALKTDPDNPYYLDSLAWVYFKQGKLDLAEENLKKALKFNSSSATVYEHLGDVYQKQGKMDLAKAAWEKALLLSSDIGQIAALKAKLNKKQAK